ncbi:flagellar biosynthetic protein FliR [Effusibacillus dendaii]|uniref:Flagellar biosynthetic protein FliR n=1 Tax=Effusibacillus dendaii TaxID=2743772 RepID=A0A7I8D8Y3_9BACL|nr:flagellar biosynthetic protein FliR [Effusibacillus dendaii]BCJ85276.1 flagellar biosynthetic protein FliR [Effusibacillus dendaii]
MNYDQLLMQAETLLLILTRVSSMFMVAPVFGMKGVPAPFKIGLSFFVSLIAFTAAPDLQNQTAGLSSPLLLLLAVVKEALVGLMIGYTCLLLFSAVQMAGQIIDMQIGFSIANVFDPQTGAAVPILGSFKNLLAILLFLGLNGHYALITAVLQSFQFVQINHFVMTDGLIEFFFKAMSVLFLLAVKIAMPAVATLFLADVGFAVLARTVPQMNVFVVGMPAKIFLGLFMLILAMPVFVYFLQDMFQLIFRQVDMLLQLLGGSP